MFLLHNTVGQTVSLPCGVVTIHGILFADDGFGNFVETNLIQVIDFILS
jgi:hypothetical protein